jgi:hypothetical protein
MIDLIDKETGKFLGRISDEDMTFLVGHLEEESEKDEDYYFDTDTLEFLKEDGLPAHLDKILTDALGTVGSVEIIFRKVQE